MNTQTQQIKKHLEDGNSITPIDALQLFGCFRLSARIHDLRDEGLKIETIMAKINGKTIAKYVLNSKAVA